jgi:hypothetical protein
MQPCVRSQVSLLAQWAGFGVWEQEPPAHASSVQATPSLHSVALQQLPQLAEPWPLSQHCLPGQSSVVWHCPPTHLPS